MGLFSSIAKTILTGEARPMDEYQRKINFTSACYELSENEGYEVIYIPDYKPPFRIGMVKCIDDLSFVELEVCKSLNYRAIIIGNNYRQPSPVGMVVQKGIATYEFLKTLYRCDINPMRIDGYGAKISTPFEFFRHIERCRKALEDAQFESDQDLSSIDNCLRAEGVPWVNSMVRVNDSKLNV